jgi:hypothetical protein
VFLMTVLYAAQVIGVFMCIKRYVFNKKQYLWPMLAGLFITADISSQIYIELSDSSLTDDLKIYASCTHPSTCKDEIGTYDLTISEDNTTLFINGYFPYGISDNVEKVLQKYPTITTISFTSRGGRSYEGVRIANIIDSHGLNTVVPRSCSSACSIAFLGGHQRHIFEATKLGFHSISLGENEQRLYYLIAKKINKQQFALQNKNGIPRYFVDKMNATPPASMWYPSTQELYDAGVITSVIGTEVE